MESGTGHPNSHSFRAMRGHPAGDTGSHLKGDFGVALESEWVRKGSGFQARRYAIAGAGGSARPAGLLNCCRQWGKSTWRGHGGPPCGTKAESLTLVISPSARQSGEFVRKAARFLERLDIQPKGDGDNEMSLLLPNRSRIVGLPGNEVTVRGFSAVSLLLIDEAARVSDEMYQAVRPMLAVSRGHLWLLSTPYGKRGFFYEAWKSGGRGWLRISVPATECPRISRSFLEEERAIHGGALLPAGIPVRVRGSEDHVFDRDVVERAITRGRRAAGAGLSGHGEAMLSRRGGSGTGVRSDGDRRVGGDSGRCGRLRLRHLERAPLGTPYPDVVERVRRITAAPDMAGRCHVVVDATGGRPVVDLLRRAPLQGELLPVVATPAGAESGAAGYYRTPKRNLILVLQSMLGGGLLQIASGLRERPRSCASWNRCRRVTRPGGNVRRLGRGRARRSGVCRGAGLLGSQENHAGVPAIWHCGVTIPRDSRTRSPDSATASPCDCAPGLRSPYRCGPRRRQQRLVEFAHARQMAVDPCVPHHI